MAFKIKPESFSVWAARNPDLLKNIQETLRKSRRLRRGSRRNIEISKGLINNMKRMRLGPYERRRR